MVDEHVKLLETEIHRLREEHAAMEKTIDAIRAMLVRRLERDTLTQRAVLGRLDRIEHTAVDSAHVLKSVVNSRIWRTFQFLGGLVLGAVPATGRSTGTGLQVLTADERKQHIQIRCDNMSPDSANQVGGKIEIKGWAFAPDGIQKLEIRIDGGQPLSVRYGNPRPDIQRLFPQIKNSLRSGYLAKFDTTELPDGLHSLAIVATSAKGIRRELLLPLFVNQELGVFTEYTRWLEIFESDETGLNQVLLSGLKYRPLVSVLVPVFKTNLTILLETIGSVRRQSYPNWELCLVDDGSGIPEITSLLEKEAAADSRIHFFTRPERGGISAASNDALNMSRGEYIALLDHDDLLADDALLHMLVELQASSKPDLLYSDEDHIDEAGRRFSPFFKPDWSPDLILSENYVCHLMMFRRDLCLSVGGFRSEFDLSQDHDILLRMSARAERILHVPKVLYHWRTSLESMTRASTSEQKAIASSRAVVESFVAGRATVEPGLHPGRWRIRYPIPAGSRVCILIPTAGKIDVLDRNLKALWKTAGYDDYEVVVIDNSKAGVVEKYVNDLAREGRPVRRFDQRGEPFNYSRLNNLAAATCSAPLLLFLNDDTEGIAHGWLEAMVELAVRPEVGAVGAKLLYPSGLIQHGGVTMGLAEICGHSFKGLVGKVRHYYDFPDLIRNVSAVTAACVMMRAEVFHQVGGFDEQTFPIAYNDIDLTLKIGAAGYRVLYTPHAALYHYEAFSKSEEQMAPNIAETTALKTKWKKVIARDPFYNPNLTRHVENWSLRWD